MRRYVILNRELVKFSLVTVKIDNFKNYLDKITQKGTF